ncbi:MAG TPA: ImuA protein [Xanthobacteraceae bacterium]|nr:ImuA protein [Xanthobacteraceae bacterium]
MTLPHVIPLHALARPRRPEVVEELRRLLWKAEGLPHRPSALPFGVPAIDAYLPQGGLTLGALHEVAPETAADTSGALGFLIAILSRLPPSGRIVIVLSPEKFPLAGRLHGHGLNTLGLDPSRLVLAESRTDKPALWAMEEALHSGVPAAVIGVTGANLDFKIGQRLNFAASEAQTPLLLLRPASAIGSGTAATRWRIGAAPAARDAFGLITRWCWQARLERCRNGRTGEWRVEYDHVAHCFSLAAAVAHSSPARIASPQSLRRACRP